MLDKIFKITFARKKYLGSVEVENEIKQNTCDDIVGATEYSEHITNKDIKILVAYHRKSTLLRNDFVMPIHVGRALAMENSKDGQISEEDFQWMMDNMIGDDTGDNISSLNRYFNEMTAIYWAWKNYEQLGNPKYFGLMHYRSIFLFSRYPYYEGNYLDCCAYQEIKNILNNNPKTIIVGDWWHPGDVTFYEHFKKISETNNDEAFSTFFFDKLYKILEIKFKDNSFREWVENRIGGPQKNMFILPKQQFFSYCEWIFPILFKFYKSIKKYKYKNVAGKRSLAYLSELLTAYYMNKIKVENSDVNVMQVPIIRPL